MVPPLPKANDSCKKEDVEQRQKIYQRFLTAICKSEVLKSNKYVVDFIKTEDRKDFDLQTKSQSYQKFSKKFEDVVNKGGIASFKENKGSKDFVTSIKDITS